MNSTQDQTRPLTGILWMLATGVNFVMVNVLVKYVGGRLPAPESAFLRFLLGLVFLVPMLKPLLATKFDSKLVLMFSARGAAHAVGVMFWFYAMAHIPMAEVTAINYLNPVFVTIGAALLLREKLALRRIGAIVVALIGALVILRPGMREIQPGHIAMLATATMFAASYLLAGRLAGRVHPLVVVAMLSIVVTIVLAPFALSQWIAPTIWEVFWLFMTAAFATTAHYTMTRAFAVAPMTVTQPVTFLQLVWASLIGATFFGEPVDHWVMLGGGMILGSVVFITWREAMLKRRTTPAVGETSLQP